MQQRARNLFPAQTTATVIIEKHQSLEKAQKNAVYKAYFLQTEKSITKNSCKAVEKKIYNAHMNIRYWREMGSAASLNSPIGKTTCEHAAVNLNPCATL